MADSEVPEFEFNAEQLDAIRASLDITDEVPAEGVEDVVIPPPVKRKRGRPRKHPLPINADGETVEPVSISPTLPPAKLSKRDEREVSERLANILIGATGIAAVAKPYLVMTDEEAKAIAEPLSSYLVRNADTIGVAQQVLENYDLLAIVLGILAYTVRIYNDRNAELETNRRNNPKPTFVDSVAEHQSSANNGQAEGHGSFVSSPYDIGGGLNS